MAQEMREQEMVSKLLKKKARADAKSRERFRTGVRCLTAWGQSAEFDQGTMDTLYSYTKEFGEDTVVAWIEKASLVVESNDARDIGRYVSGIRRKIKEAVS